MLRAGCRFDDFLLLIFLMFTNYKGGRFLPQFIRSRAVGSISVLTLHFHLLCPVLGMGMWLKLEDSYKENPPYSGVLRKLTSIRADSQHTVHITNASLFE